MTRAGLEDDINTVDVLSFKPDPSHPNDMKLGTFFYRARGRYETQGGQSYVRVELVSSTEPQTLVVLANARAQVDALGATYGEPREQVMSRLTFDVGADAAPHLTGGMPMWGELPNETVGRGFSPLGAPKEVTLIRSVAKFTLVNPPKNDLNGKDFFYYYDQLRLYNYRSKGRIAPDNYNAANQKVNTPTVPSGARQTGHPFTPLVIDPSDNFIYHGHEKSFYLCEVDNTVRPTGGNALDDLCLIVHVKVHNPNNHPEVTQDGYYRLDFKDYATGNPIDILRNHDYRIVVDEVQGLPANTPEEAFNGRYTLKCKIVPWNAVHEEGKVSGNKRLTVDKRVFQFPGDPNVAGETGGTQTLTLSTENTGGWRIDGIPAWVNLSQTSGADGTPVTVTLSVGVNPGRTDRTAVMNLVADNLTYRIHISQPDACGKNGVPQKMHIGNNDYYTHRFGGPNGQCWMLENSREGTPDHILPALPGRPYRRYLWNAFNYASPAKIGLPTGWAGPTYTDVYNLKKATFPDGTGSDIGTEKWLWLQWQKDPGVVSYHPTFDGNGPLVEPAPEWANYGGRTPDKFWPGDYQAWEYRRLPRLVSYIQKQQDNISAFWSHQWITNASWDSGIHEIPAANGQKAHAYMARMPIVTVNVGIPNPYQCCIYIATDLREPGTHANPYERAKDWMTIYWWVNPSTGENWSWGPNGPWGSKGLLRKATSHAGWFGPKDMPWRLTPSQFYNTMLERDSNVYADLLGGGQFYYKTKQSSSYPYSYERDFYPGAKELSTYDPALPTSTYNMIISTQSGLGAYMENLLPVRFVRRD